MLETYTKLGMTEHDFLEKLFLPPELGKWTKKGPKTGFFEFIEKFGYKFLVSLFYNEIFFYLLCFCTNPMQILFLKNFFPEK